MAYQFYEEYWKLTNAFTDYNEKSRFRDVKIYFDVDPQSVM